MPCRPLESVWDPQNKDKIPYDGPFPSRPRPFAPHSFGRPPAYSRWRPEKHRRLKILGREGSDAPRIEAVLAHKSKSCP